MNGPAFPAGLHLFAIASLSVAAACAITIAFDELRRPQRMGVMNAVWPPTALFGSVLWLAGYYRWGRAAPAAAKAGTVRSPFRSRSARAIAARAAR